MFSIIYANRNRDIKRIEASLTSLKEQVVQNFEVIFVDYGSNSEFLKALQALEKKFYFLKFFHLPVSQVLWNKSKALNWGIKRSNFSSIFIADVDLIFHPESTKLFQKVFDPKKFFLFKLGYLNKGESRKLEKNYNFKNLRPIRFGYINGMVLASKEAFLDVQGFDEFFHFYGSEDEDLFARLENAGYTKEANDRTFFYHNWHLSFSGSEDKILTGNPRVKNIMRINQRHFFSNRDRKITKPEKQKEMGKWFSREEMKLLRKPDKIYFIKNIVAHVEHFLREELPLYEGKVVEVRFVQDPYYNTVKYRVKKLLGKQSQLYCSMKELNDIVLKEIVFNYRDANYFFKISKNLKEIIFCLQVEKK